jgi:succinoglycan biosynthesis protein ExoV
MGSCSFRTITPKPLDAWRKAAARTGIEYLSPSTESREVIARLRRAKLVLADAMHTAILADAMRVPWIPLATSPEISMKIPYAPVTLAPASLASRVHYAMLHVRGDPLCLRAH